MPKILLAILIIYLIIGIAKEIFYKKNKNIEKIVKEEKNKNVKIQYVKIAIFLIIAIFPFIWYLVIKNHSYVHAFFTYRNLLLTIIALPIGIDKLCDTNIKKGAKELG